MQAAMIAFPYMSATSHFNQLTEAEAERLAIVIEECGEVTQSACKILRHGYASHNPQLERPDWLPPTNRDDLEREVGDLLHAIDRLCNAGDVRASRVIERQHSKPNHIRQYLHHQQNEGK